MPAIIGISLFGFAYESVRNVNVLRNRYYQNNTIKYTTETELRTDLDKQIKLLHLENQTIQLKYEAIPDFRGGVRGGSGNYTITLHPDYKSRFVIRHELFHIYRYVNNKIQNYPLSKYFEEWLATSYAADDNANLKN